MTVLYPNSMLNPKLCNYKVCYKGTVLFCSKEIKNTIFQVIDLLISTSY